MSRKWVAIRLGTESRDKSLPVPTNYRCGVLNTNAQVPGQKGGPQYPKILRRLLLPMMYSRAYTRNLYNYRKYFNKLDISGLNFPLKFTDTHKFETLNPSINVNVLVFENNEVFPLYASKHRDRIHHVNLLMISNSEGKFHYRLVRDLFALVAGRTKSHVQAQVCPYCLYCFSEARLLTAHLPDCSVHPEQKVEYPSPDDPEKKISKCLKL